MAGCRRRLHLLLLLAAALLTPSPCCSSAAATTASVTSADVSKVSLALYYETLCPFCSRFIVNHLAKVFEDGLIDIVDLRLVPYGNSHVGPNGTISCQHGPDECLLNTVEACAIEAWPDLNVHFSFIYCVEDLVVQRKYLEWVFCFDKLGLDPKPVMDCYQGEKGKELELKYAKQTDALQPPHRYVPWVVVNGRPLYEDYETFEAYVCEAYKGHPPKACEGLVHATPKMVKAGQSVSYNDDISLAAVEDDARKIKMVIDDIGR